MVDPKDFPLGPRIVMVLVGLFFFGLFIGGFDWERYVFPTMMGPLYVSPPGKYLVMAAFLLLSMIFISVATPLLRFQKFMTYSFFAALILLFIGGLVLR